MISPLRGVPLTRPIVTVLYDCLHDHIWSLPPVFSILCPVDQSVSANTDIKSYVASMIWPELRIQYWCQKSKQNSSKFNTYLMYCYATVSELNIKTMITWLIVKSGIKHECTFEHLGSDLFPSHFFQAVRSLMPLRVSTIHVQDSLGLLNECLSNLYNPVAHHPV